MVDEKVATLYGKLVSKQITYYDGWIVQPGELVPDPLMQPEAWIKAFNSAGWSVLFVSPTHIELRSPRGEWSKHHGFAAAIKGVAEGR